MYVGTWVISPQCMTMLHLRLRHVAFNTGGKTRFSTRWDGWKIDGKAIEIEPDAMGYGEFTGNFKWGYPIFQCKVVPQIEFTRSVGLCWYFSVQLVYVGTISLGLIRWLYRTSYWDYKPTNITVGAPPCIYITILYYHIYI